MISLIFLLSLATALEAAESLRPVSAVLHAHSNWSSGALTLDELVARARAAGVEAVFLTENHLLRFEYGLPPLRNLLRYRVEYPSLLSRGLEPFLEAVRAANARQTDVLLIPGTEVIPHYYWTGDLLQGTLTMHNGQKNILAFGLYRAEDYRELPAVGNAGAARWDGGSYWLLAPAALVIPGVWLLRTRRRRVIHLRHFRITEERRLTGYGLLCIGVGALLLANNFPFRRPPVSAYDSGAGLAPYQAVIDFVSARGGVAAWSMPEARDNQAIERFGLRASIRTDPYPSDLLQTDRFAAFGGVYEDTTTFTEPGGGWDQLLARYLDGRRAAPAWAIGEAAYHREGQAAKRFGTILTVLLAERRDPSGILEAVRRGRMYAVERRPDTSLVLDRFHVLLPGQGPVEAGGRLIGRAGDRPEVLASIRTTGGRGMAVEARLVRSGTLMHSQRGETPMTFRWSDAPLPAGARLFYRLEVRGPGGHRLLANPIFVHAGPEGNR
jgi:hypothetical protein